MFDKCQMSKKPLTRTRSDTKLKADFVEFIDDWNTQKEPEYHFHLHSKDAQLKKQMWIEEILDVLLRPVINLCRRTGKQRRWSSESSVRCRQTSQSVESDQIPCPISKCRSLSESNLRNVEHVKCIAEFSPERQKKVCFSAPTSSSCAKAFEKRCCPTSRPRSILMQKSCISEKPEYMSYSNFKAWRRGSRLSIDVCSMPLKLKETKDKKFEKLVKNFLSNCVNQLNNRALPDM